MRVLVLGSTGRLGQAVVEALAGHAVTGLARHPPAGLQADRQDVRALAQALADADAVVDLCAFTPEDAEALLAAVGNARIRLVFASSIAALGRPDAPLDAYGLGKRRIAEAYRQRWPGPVTTLLLPHLIAADARAPERTYLHDARRLGHAWLPGAGTQRPALAPVQTVARLIGDLLQARVPPGELQVGHPQPQPVRALVEALLEGAGLPPLARPHPDPTWRGPHAGADEPLDLTQLQAFAPDLAWPDLLATHRELGAWLARLP